EFRLLGVGAEERVALDLVPIPARAIDAVRPDLDERAAHAQTRHDLPRDRAGGDAGCGLARRGASAAAVVAQSVFEVVGDVGVTGPVEIPYVGIVLRALVDILDQERDRRAGRHLAPARFVRHDAG